jgi:hypothetical protein
MPRASGAGRSDENDPTPTWVASFAVLHNRPTLLKDLPSSLVQLRNAVWTGDTRDTRAAADLGYWSINLRSATRKVLPNAESSGTIPFPDAGFKHEASRIH